MTPTATGTINAGLRDRFENNTRNQGYAFQVGVANGTTLTALAGIVPDTTVSAPPSIGTGTYSGRYEILSGRIIGATGPNTREFQAFRDTGDIDITVNYGTGAFTGTTNKIGGPRLSGRVEGRNLTGTVRSGVTTGNLRGLVGADRAVGAFQAINNLNNVFAGGFNATRN